MKTFCKSALVPVFILGSLNLSAQTDTVAQTGRRIDSPGQKMEPVHSPKENDSPIAHDLKEINLTGAFHHAEIRGDVTMILTNGPTDRLWLRGDLTDLDHVQTTLKDENLVVNAENRKRRSKLTVYMSITGLTSLIINGDSEIFSAGTIQARDLEIFLDGTSLVSVKYMGAVKVLAVGRCEFVDIKDYKKYIR